MVGTGGHVCVYMLKTSLEGFVHTHTQSEKTQCEGGLDM